MVKLDLGNAFNISSIIDDAGRAAYDRSCLGGYINSSLLNLKELTYLDLSLNNFNGTTIPTFLGSFKNLRYLNLSSSSFGGVVPPHIGNLSNLRYLDLNASPFPKRTFPKLLAESLDWLSQLSSLEFLNMAFVNLKTVGPHWLHVISKLPSLLELHLAKCGLVNLPLSVSSTNFTSLSHLDLSYNNFNSKLPPWLFNMSCLRVINLRSNYFQGEIPNTFATMVSLEEFDLVGNIYIQGQLPRTLGNVSSLRRLDMAANNISGKIPSSFGNLCNLETLNLMINRVDGELTEFVDGLSRCAKTRMEYLELARNKLGGTLPETIGMLSKLEYLGLARNSFSGSIPASIGSLLSLRTLDLTSNSMNGTIHENIGKLSTLAALYLGANSWEGTLTEAHFQNLSNLQTLKIYPSDYFINKTLAIDLRPGWIPPFSRLQFVTMDDTQMRPSFPTWILKIREEESYISLNNVGIDDTIPPEFWMACSNIKYLSMNNNKLKGKIPQHLVFPIVYYVDLSFNNLDGPLPKLLPTSLIMLFLHNNFFSGPLPENVDQLEWISYLDLSSNSIEGRLPASISKLKRLTVLTLKNNNMSGELPENWMEMPSLRVFDITNNSFSGKVPLSMGFLSSLRLLSLGNNNFQGELPPSLGNLTMLVSLNLGGNKFNGSLPTWIGAKLSSLMMLNLRSNLFDGHMPRKLCRLSRLQLLDLAHNNFSGVIPLCLGNLSKGVTTAYGSFSPYQHMMVVSKGRELYYDGNLYLVNSLDLSYNSLSGEIPESIMSLSGLRFLNLSMNYLSGRVPEKIGDLKMLESFDVSRNKLSGPIPLSLSSLTFLSHLNLSYNNLTGKIPSGNQLQTLDDPSIYEGNLFLCGPPLASKHCPWEDNNDGGDGEDNDGTGEIDWSGIYISMAVGFCVGFWAVCGSLTVKSSWRHAYFRCCEDFKERIIVFFSLKLARLRRN